MPRLVMKFGGTSVATVERIHNVARHVKREIAAGYDVAVVVSAMSGKTNELVAWCKEAAPLHDMREYDVVVASGEQVTSGLLAIALQARGVPARSWQGWQIPLLTGEAHGAARIESIEPKGILEGFERKETAVGAERCDIYTDVDGVYTTDPRVVSKARRMDRIAFEEMLEMASLGAKVMQVRSVELALKHDMPTYVRSSFDDPDDPRPGTLICREEDIMESQVVTGVAFSRDEAQITLRRVIDKPGVAASVFMPLAEAGINVDMIVQTVSADNMTDMTFTVAAADFDRARALLEKAQGQIGYVALAGAKDVAKVSVIGVGMRSHTGVAAKGFRALADKGVNIRAISTSEIKFSVLIDAAYTELAVRTLHSLYGLDGED